MPSQLNRWERLALITLLIVGAWLRFQHIGAIEYNIDQVYPVWQAIHTLDTGALPLTGQGTSVLFANPPLTGYLFLPFLALLRQPITAYAVTLTLNTFAIWLAWRTLRRLVGIRPALVGAALLAVNPWIIEDSRRTWVQSLSPFFVCLVLWALVPVLRGQTRHPARRTVIGLVGLALFANTYLLAYALAAPVALLIVLFWARIPRRAVAMGVLIFTVLLGFYAVGLAQDWDATIDSIRDFQGGGAHLSDEALTHALRLVTGWEYAAARGVSAPADDAELRNDISNILHIVWTAALVVGFGMALLALFRRGSPQNQLPVSREAALILLIWFGLPVILMSYVSQKVHPFYLLLTIPAGHGLAALALAPLLRRPALASGIAALVMITGVVNGLNTVRFAQATAAHPGEDLPETLPLADATALGRRISEARGDDMALFSPMESWTPVTLAGHDFRSEQATDFDRALLIPPGGALFVVFDRPPDLYTPRPLLGAPAGDLLALADGTLITLWRVFPSDLYIDHPVTIPSDIDVTFLGWTLHGDLEPGETAHLDTGWQIEALHPDRGVWAFAPFVHVLDSHGGQVLVADGTVIPPLIWRAGDRMVQRLELSLPTDAPADVGIIVGLYDPVRVREDGAPGINAIFRLPPATEGGETIWTAAIPLITAGEE